MNILWYFPVHQVHKIAWWVRNRIPGDKDDEKNCPASSLQWSLGDRSVLIRTAMSPLSKWRTSCTLPTQTNSQLHSKVLLIINTINVLQHITWTQLYIWKQLIASSLDIYCAAPNISVKREKTKLQHNQSNMLVNHYFLYKSFPLPTYKRH